MVFASYNNIISPLGFTTFDNYGAINKSQTAVKKVCLPFSEEPFCLAKINDEEIAQKFSSFGDASIHTKLEQLSILSIQDVIKQSGINVCDERTLLIYSTTKGNIDILENRYKNINSKRIYLHAFAKHLQLYFKFKHTPLVLSNACISGVLALIIAQRFINSKQYNNVIVCGGDIVSEFTISGFKSFNAMSQEPSRPYDANRVGINLGEAVSTILITNDYNLAAPYKTQLITGASANDANHISGPSRTGEGLYNCVAEVLNYKPSQLGFISAHGTATQFNDEMESIAFDRAKLNTVPVNSLKGYYGHTLGASGVVETVLSLESLKKQRLIKSLGYETKGVSGDIKIINEHENKTFTSFLKTASGFGGCNAAALFELI